MILDDREVLLRLAAIRDVNRQDLEDGKKGGYVGQVGFLLGVVQELRVELHNLRKQQAVERDSMESRLAEATEHLDASRRSAAVAVAKLAAERRDRAGKPPVNRDPGRYTVEDDEAIRSGVWHQSRHGHVHPGLIPDCEECK